MTLKAQRRKHRPVIPDLAHPLTVNPPLGNPPQANPLLTNTPPMNPLPVNPTIAYAFKFMKENKTLAVEDWSNFAPRGCTSSKNRSAGGHCVTSEQRTGD